MTKRQAEKLGRIIAKLEALQSEVSSRESDGIEHAKRVLLPLWSKNDK